MSEIGSVMSDVGNIYYKGFENLFGGAYGQRKLTGGGRHSDNRNTRAHPHDEPDPLRIREEGTSNEINQKHYEKTNEHSSQNLDYNADPVGVNFGPEEESNYLYYDHVPTFGGNYAKELSSVPSHEYTTSEAPDYDYSIYEEYAYVPNYLDEAAGDDFR